MGDISLRGTLWDKEVAIKRLKHRKLDNQAQQNIQKEVEVMMSVRVMLPVLLVWDLTPFLWDSNSSGLFATPMWFYSSVFRIRETPHAS